ncbi:F/Y-rich N-terminus-domain-containing protein [Choanephora cucurbitarum]|nr:F/Y-rich N-terminus-domain-containing protein [Choanephora cucurbitarum]
MNSPIHQDKYNKIKRKLRETVELNEALSRGLFRAKKKIRILNFEKNLLLDSMTRLSHSVAINDDSTNDDNRHFIEESTSETEVSIRPFDTKPTLTTVASAPPKRSKINRVNVKIRRVQPIERDDEGNPILPQQIGVLTVLSLGTIITDRDTFHNERYIFPVGYTVRRTYPSMVDPNNNTIITSTILDGGDGPRFHVVAADQLDKPIVANSATGAWTVVVRRSNEIRHRDHSNSASGPDYYGFKHPTIAKMIQDLPNSRNLKNYVWQDFEEMEPKAAKGVMAAAEKKRDNLEHMGNANRKAVQYLPLEDAYSYFVQPAHPVRVNQSDEEVYELGTSDTES